MNSRKDKIIVAKTSSVVAVGGEGTVAAKGHVGLFTKVRRFCVLLLVVLYMST